MLGDPVSTNARVLVLVAAYNGAAWIEEQLQSVLGQLGVEVRVEVADDCSSDATRDILASLADADCRLQWTAREARSGSAAANFIRLICDACVDCATHVALCDQDDIWSDSKLRAASDRLADTGADLYSSATLAFWPDGSRTVLTQSRATTPADFLFEGGGQGCTFVMNASLFLRIQAFLRTHFALLDPIHYHDWLIFALARTWNAGWVYDATPRVHYRQHGANDTGARNGVAAILKRLALIRSGWYRDQVDLITRICHAADPQCAPVTRYLRLRSKAAGGGAVARFRLALFALSSGRRRWSDRFVVVGAILAGYFNG